MTTITTTTTPRKRKNLTLANLHSNLSEKYIGFNVDPTSPNVMSPRQLRGRLSNGGGGNGNSSITETTTTTQPEAIALENISPSSGALSPVKVHKNFISPIEKLLLKNGSTSISPIRNSNAHHVMLNAATPLNKKISGGGDRGRNLSLSIDEQMDVASLSEDRKERSHANDEKLTKGETKFAEVPLITVSTPEAASKHADKTIAATLKTEVLDNDRDDDADDIDDNVHDDDVHNDEVDDEEESLEYAVGIRSSNADAHDVGATKMTSHHIKSPSAVSLDSAKGSSVANETAWMSYAVGDLYWGQIFSYCYWPCLVCPDPDDGTVVKEEHNSRSGEPQVMVHVRFFADNGRRNWVKSENLMPYEGLPSYQEYVDKVLREYGKKSAKYKMLQPKGTKKTLWYEAINEANILIDLAHSERLQKFFAIHQTTKRMQEMKREKFLRDTFMPIEIMSDFGSIADSSETMESATTLYPMQKRKRSTSPFSPAYSPLKAAGAKRQRKVGAETYGSEFGMEEYREAMESSELSAFLNAKTQSAKDFKRFYAIMRDFVMGDNVGEQQLEQSFIKAVHNIWELREISQMQFERSLLEANDEQHMGSSLISVGGNDGKIKRLSNRLRSFMARRRSSPQSKNSSPVARFPAAMSLANSTTSSPSIVEKPKKPPTIRPIEAVVEDIYKLDRKYLFKGLGREPICKYCYRSGDDVKLCDGDCHAWLHAACAGKQRDGAAGKKVNKRGRRSGQQPLATDDAGEQGATENPTDDVVALNDATAASASVRCVECARDEGASCRICLKADHPDGDEPLIACNMPNCHNKFHPGCCKYWPQAKITKSQHGIESFRCPSHVCHTCVSDDPKHKFQHLSNVKIIRCIKCPASFHTDSTCIPAGSQILNAAHIICPRHSGGKSKAATNEVAVNVNWCFICVGGGQLMCCETCPTAVHAQCLNIPFATHEAYICEECESGRMPLYGEMVWAKFNTFRWWPAIILPPPAVPQNILRMAHSASDFVVRFFGTHDHGWISRNRVYVYIEGDTSNPPARPKSSMDMHYKRGIEEAKSTYELIKTLKQAHRLKNDDKEKLLPQPYTRIKTNRPVPPVKLHTNLDMMNVCNCRAEDENPCGPDSDCLSRLLYHECHPKMCPAGERCQNRMFEARISLRLNVVYMQERGFGLVCRERIAAGSFIIEYVGEVINQKELQQRLNQKSIDRDENYYFLTVERDYIIDAGPKGNLARFMNHSCEPNCEVQKWLVNGINRVGLFALQDIPENTELTFNYNWDELLGTEKKICICGAAKCAGEIGGKYRREEKAKNDLKLPTTSKAAAAHQKKTAAKKPLKRLEKPLWKINPAKNTKNTKKKSSKVNVVAKQKLITSNHVANNSSSITLKSKKETTDPGDSINTQQLE